MKRPTYAAKPSSALVSLASVRACGRLPLSECALDKDGGFHPPRLSSFSVADQEVAGRLSITHIFPETTYW
jgi:hypothetical protein